MKIYVASSWRNAIQPLVVSKLREAGHEVYDFRSSEGFSWSHIDPGWRDWTIEEYKKNLDHPLAVKGFRADHEAMEWADVFVGVQPFGRSASIEMGWAVGKGKATILLLAPGEPELMIKEFNFICLSIDQVLDGLRLVGELRRIDEKN